MQAGGRRFESDRLHQRRRQRREANGSPPAGEGRREDDGHGSEEEFNEIARDAASARNGGARVAGSPEGGPARCMKSEEGSPIVGTGGAHCACTARAVGVS